MTTSVNQVAAAVTSADENTVRDVIHRFNESGLISLAPLRAGGRPGLLSTLRPRNLDRHHAPPHHPAAEL
ncbi:hypothetical protein [Streptomyces sp. NPDC091217]|uniref:hypothetical protein n=1 Tax=Streptomyces sp. NPDC091217 TaxID=3365975 RepID=UPI00382A0132